jgi:hypothetical protein
MIKMRGEGAKGRPVIILGLSEANIDRLREGKPIHLHADDMGFVGEIVIFVGKDEATMARQMQPFIGPGTVVHDESKRPRQ